jgi:hypothetical protein
VDWVCVVSVVVCTLEHPVYHPVSVPVSVAAMTDLAHIVHNFIHHPVLLSSCSDLSVSLPGVT